MLLLIKASLIILLVLSSLIFGVILARLTKEELAPGRKYFKLAAALSLLLLIASIDAWFFKIIDEKVAISTAVALIYMAVIASISVKRGHDVRVTAE